MSLDNSELLKTALAESQKLNAQQSKKLAKAKRKILNLERELEIDHTWTRHRKKTERQIELLKDLPVPRLELAVVKNTFNSYPLLIQLHLVVYEFPHAKHGLTEIPLAGTYSSTTYEKIDIENIDEVLLHRSVFSSAVAYKRELKLPSAILIYGVPLDISGTKSAELLEGDAA